MISGVGDRIPESIRALVYLDAFVLEEGESLIDLVTEGQAEDMREQARTFGDGWKIAPIPAKVFAVNARDAAWVDAQCTPQPIACFEQPIHFKGGLGRIRNITHILATGFRDGSPFPACHDRAKKKGWKTATMDSGHDVMLDRPEELTAFFLAQG